MKQAIAVAFLFLILLLPISTSSEEPIATHKAIWNKPDRTLQVNIISDVPIPEWEKIIIKNTIMDEQSTVNDGKKFYSGWKGALIEASEQKTPSIVPTIFDLTENNQNADIIITLTQLKDEYGMSGYTRNTVSNNFIIKSHIIIYDIKNLKSEEFATILRHEFGHAMGLSHSTCVQDLMYDSVTSPTYISESDVDTILTLYS